MASIDTGQSGSSRKSVSQELPLVPFIDLLFCCVMFLLATAVWNSVDQISASTNNAIDGTQDPIDAVSLYLLVHHDGFTIASDAGDRVNIPSGDVGLDYASLGTHLADRRRLEPSRSDIILVPDDDVDFEHLVRSMDLAVGEGFVNLRVSDQAAL
ncbi:MAG: biopolymer transport protein ExbD [Polyangiales bacterium]|jgi:biopolymer transport protein ExbD